MKGHVSVLAGEPESKIRLQPVFGLLSITGFPFLIPTTPSAFNVSPALTTLGLTCLQLLTIISMRLNIQRLYFTTLCSFYSTIKEWTFFMQLSSSIPITWPYWLSLFSCSLSPSSPNGSCSQIFSSDTNAVTWAP